MKKSLILTITALFLSSIAQVSAQITIRIPRLPRVEERRSPPEPTRTDSPQTGTSESSEATPIASSGADLYHWRKWSFRWKRVRVDNGGTFNHDTYPNAHYIDKNPGDYFVKIYRNGTQVREAYFSVGPDGRVVDHGHYKPGYLTYHKVIIPVKVIGGAEKWNASAWMSEAFYGNPMSSFSIP